MRRDEGGIRPSSWKEGSLDDLARDLETGAISRSKAIRLGGAALVASTLGLFASRSAEAQEVDLAVSRRRCNRRYRRSDFCRNRGAGDRCDVCCNRESRRPKACCGLRGCNCCRRSERCTDAGMCV